MTRVKVAICACAVLILLALAFALLQSPVVTTGENVASATALTTIRHRLEACQAGEDLPRGTSALRLRIYTVAGPRVTLRVSEAGHVIAHGERAPGWTGGAVTVAVQPLSTARHGVSVCFGLALAGEEAVELLGARTAVRAAAAGRAGRLPGRIKVEYLRAQRSSWFSLAPEVARRMGLGHAASGTWSAVFVFVVMCAVALLASRGILRETR